MRHESATRQATRLVRLYPPHWRRRFPDFVQVLALELEEHRRGVAWDVVREATSERLRSLGIVLLGQTDRTRSGLALIYAPLVPFVGLTLGLWSQLHTGLVGHDPSTPPVLRASDLLLGLTALAALFLLPCSLGIALFRVRRPGRGSGDHRDAERRRWIRPTTALATAMAVLTALGWSADRSGWKSPAALALPGRGFGHFSTLWIRALVAPITPAWIHPGMFASMPPGELVAVFLAPVFGILSAVALLRMVSSLPLPGRAEVVLGVLTLATMVLATAASLRWILTHPAQEDQLAPGHTGVAVVVLLGVMAATALIGTRRVIGGHGEPPAQVEADSWQAGTEAPASSGSSPLLLVDQ